MATPSRRSILATAATVGFGTVAGCLGDSGQSALTDETNPAGDVEPALTVDISETAGGSGPPVVDRTLPRDYEFGALVDAAQSGGPPQDGIPSIDSPSFNDADSPPAGLGEASPVFGVDIEGDVRAYPQYILVWHEIVNDIVGDESVAVTYCPLTGTAQGFYRGNVTFGVSGQLINSNLVMFDRATESWWPQMLAEGIQGPHENDTLEEFQIVWTTWERWKAEYPDTLVLNENTGAARNYGADPYGSYDPVNGYYEDDNTLFPPLQTDDRFPPKEVVIGTRNQDGASCINKDQLREERIIEGSLDGIGYTCVYDEALDTGYVYRNPDEVAVRTAGAEYEVDDSSYAADALPLPREIGYDAMWFAWFGYYPSTEVLA